MDPRTNNFGEQVSEVEFARIPAAVRRFGISRSRMYLLSQEGKITFIKIGPKAVVVDLASVRRYLTSLVEGPGA